MIKKFYVLVWLLLAGSVVVTALNGELNGFQLVAFSLVALALVHGLALWAVVMNTAEPQAQ